MDTLTILLALATVGIPALTEAAVATTRLFGERAREGSTHTSEKLGSEKLADLCCLRVSKSMKMIAMRHTVAAIGLGGMLAALATQPYRQRPPSLWCSNLSTPLRNHGDD